MKTISFCVLLMTFLAVQSQAVNVDVPQVVSKAFNKLFPSAEDVNWELSGTHFVADFFHDKDGYFKEVTFDRMGTWLETKTDLDAMDLPDAIQNYIVENYGSMEDSSNIIKLEKPKEVQYVLDLETVDGEIQLVFDAAGNLLEE